MNLDASATNPSISPGFEDLGTSIEVPSLALLDPSVSTEFLSFGLDGSRLGHERFEHRHQVPGRSLMDLGMSTRVSGTNTEVVDLNKHWLRHQRFEPMHQGLEHCLCGPEPKCWRFEHGYQDRALGLYGPKSGCLGIKHRHKHYDLGQPDNRYHGPNFNGPKFRHLKLDLGH